MVDYFEQKYTLDTQDGNPPVEVYTFVDTKPWSPTRELKIQGYIELANGVSVTLGTMAMGKEYTTYTFIVDRE